MANRESRRFWAGRTVAVTGASGFVGSHLVQRLVRCGARVRALLRPNSRREHLVRADVDCLNAPLESPAALARAMVGCEVLFHVAGAVDFASDWHRFEQANISGTENVLVAARWSRVDRVVVTSSIVAVGASRDGALLDESAAWNLEKYRVPYVTTKRRAEQIALAAGRDGMDVVVVNPSSVVGPQDYQTSEFGALCRRFWKKRIPFRFGGGNNYVDVRDVAVGHLLAAEHGVSGERYILGGHNCSTSEFFEELSRSAGESILQIQVPSALGSMVGWLNDHWFARPGKRSYLTARQARLLPLFFFFSSRKAQHQLEWSPRPLEETLSDAHDFWTNRRSA